MTGPASISRIIMLAVVFCVLSHASYASAPRDAIKYLKFTHSSDFVVVESDTGSNSSYDDRYSGNWKFTWTPPNIELPIGARLRTDLLYEVLLTDSHQRSQGNNNNTRNDHVHYGLQVQGLSKADFVYNYDHNDRYEDGPKWIPQQTQTANLTLYPPNLPAVTVGWADILQSQLLNGQLISSSETSLLNYALDYRKEQGNIGQQIRARNEFRRIRNQLDGGGINESTSQLNGYRTFPLAEAGVLKMFYDYTKQTRSSIGALEPVDTVISLYGVDLSNKLQFLPVNYSFNYSGRTTDISANPGTTTEIKRRFNLSYAIPVPKNKRLTLALANEFRELEQQDRHNSTDTQRIRLDMKFNPRTSGFLQHETSVNVDDLSLVTQNKRETLAASGKYDIPGKRGSLNGEFSQQSEISQVQQRQVVNKYVSLNNQFRLGDNASMNFIFQQSYGDSDSIDPESSVDSTFSGIHYHIDSRTGLSLDARWLQRLRVSSVTKKVNSQDYNIQLRYDTPANWRYEFIINQNGTKDVSQFDINREEYRSSNHVIFRVTYSF